MAKISEAPVGSTDISEFLNTQDDFALELFVYHEAQKLGLEVSHGGAYEDPLTHKSRQYDLRACRISGDNRIDLAIECKSLRQSFPLLISRMRRTGKEAYHQIICSHGADSGASLTTALLGSNARSANLTDRDSLYPEGEFVGKATVQVGRTENGQFVSGDNQAFEKWSQALASAADLVFDASRHHEQSEHGKCNTFVCPVLVVQDGTLWTIDYGDDGAALGSPIQRDDAQLYVGRKYWTALHPGYAISHLHVFTRHGLVSWLQRVADDPVLWMTVFPKRALQQAMEVTD